MIKLDYVTLMALKKNVADKKFTIRIQEAPEGDIQGNASSFPEPSAKAKPSKN